jgi:hypothetical protein
MPLVVFRRLWTLNDMGEMYFQIDDERHDFSDVWVHLQDVTISDSRLYTFCVPRDKIIRVFDPTRLKPDDQSWQQFIERMVAELGTFIVEAYIKSIRSYSEARENRFRWVIASIDEIRETDEGISINGRAVPFHN